MKLEEYDYEVVHKAGRYNTNADALSRIPYEVADCNAITRSKKAQDNVPTDLISNTDVQIKVNTRDEINNILKEFNDCPLGGHQGVKRTLDKIRQYYTWENINQDVMEYVKKCKLCQLNKEGFNPKQPMVLTTTSKRAFEKIFLDVVGPLSTTNNGNNYILTMMDDLSKLAIAIPIPNQTANTIAKDFATKFICVYGCPESILTDQGTNFMSAIFKSLCKILAIDKLNTASYHPQTNGTLERSHHTLATYLRMYTNSSKNDWDEWLPYACFCYNTTPHTSSGFTPYELVYGQKPMIPSSIHRAPTCTNFDDYDKELKHRLQSAWRIAMDHIDQSKETSKGHYDKNSRPKEFKIGDQVLYRNQTRSGKLDQLWDGPFEIVDVSDVNSKIKIKLKEKNVHNNDLKLFHSDRTQTTS